MRRLISAGKIGVVSGALARHSHGGPEVYYAEVTDTFEEPRAENDFWFFDADTAGGGALIDMGVYAIATLVALLGKVTAVTARMTTVNKPTAMEDTATLIYGLRGRRLGHGRNRLVRSRKIIIPARSWHNRKIDTRRRFDPIYSSWLRRP